MVAFLLLFAYVLLSGGQMILNKTYQMRVRMSTPTYMLYLIVMGTVAAFLFYLMAGCDLAGDRALYICSFVASLIVIISTLVSLLSLSYANLAMVTVCQNAGTLVLPALFGFVFLREPVSAFRVIGIALIIAAFLVSFFGTFRSSEGQKKQGMLGRSICVLLFFTSGLGNIIHKIFTVSGSSASHAAYLSWINLFMVPIIVVAFLLLRAKRKEQVAETLRGIDFRNYWLVCAGSAIGCVGMICSMRAMAGMDMAIYSPMYSSLYMIFLVAASKWIFKEKISKENYISIGLAILSVLATVMG